VDIGTQPHVISQIKADMVRIWIDDNFIAVPEPVVTKSVVVWGYAEVKAVKPEARWTASRKPPYVTAAKPARKMPMRPRVREMVVRIAAASDSDPLTVMVNVRSVGMPGHIAVVSGRCPARLNASGTMRRNKSMTNVVSAPAPSLRKCGNRKHHGQHNKKSQSLFHVSLRWVERMVTPPSSFLHLIMTQVCGSRFRPKCQELLSPQRCW
jgi:hypothetical protein